MPLSRENDGHFSGLVDGARAGTRYRLAIDGEPSLVPDPFSRWQPEGPHGPSVVVDPSRFAWTDSAWRGRTLREAVLYELHVGTFTPEGTWQAAMARLPYLAELGVTALDVLPVAEFPGAFGWGYDGVSLFAPYHGYGTPDDLRAFVDRAHAHGIAVLLDVVYNHLGPDGNYLWVLAPECFTDRYETEWGTPFDLDGPRSGPVRDILLANAAFWVREYHLDGLRLDATQNVYDFGSGEHILAAITRTVREAAGGRTTLVIGENEPQHVRLVEEMGMDALWNDDLHHSAIVAVTGRNEAYYADHLGSSQELVSALELGYLFQGQHYAWQAQPRGTPTDALDPAAFVAYLENHDQVANTLDGRRLHQLTSPAKNRAISALVLLGPGTPMLFQGQEMLSRAPFLYFADHVPELAAMVAEGRAEFLLQFASLHSSRDRFADPAARSTFERSRLDWSDAGANADHVAMVRELLRLRRTDEVLSGRARARVSGAVLADAALVLRLVGAERGDDRLLVTNLGKSRRLSPCPEPRMAPPLGARWKVVLATEEPRWGGRGVVPFRDDEGAICLTAECTVLLAPEPDPDAARRFGPPKKKTKNRPRVGEEKA